MSNRLLVAVLVALTLSGLLAGPVLAQEISPQPQRNNSKMVVNTPVDAVDPNDGVLSLREAMMLAEGSLYYDRLSPEEQNQITGHPGGRDWITFDREVFSFFNGPPIYVHEPLPALATGWDIIDGRSGVTLVGQHGRAPGLYIASPNNMILGVEMVGFGDAIVIAGQRSNQIRQVQLYNNHVGIYIYGYLAVDNVIRESNLERNRRANIVLGYNADRNRIERNDLEHSRVGIEFEAGADRNRVKGNDISYNHYGVLVSRRASGNEFDDNRFRGNRVDIKRR